MRRQFIIFFSIVLTVYGLINFYIFFKGWYALSLVGEYRPWILTIGILLALSYPVGRFLERVSLSRFTEILVYVGSVWLAEMVYLFLSTAVTDMLHALLFVTSLDWIYNQFDREYLDVALAFVVFFISTVATLWGFLNAKFPRVKKLDLTVPRKASSADHISLAVVSDIHLGTIMGPRRLKYIIEKINSIGADIVLLAGDVFDEDIGRVIKNNLGDLLRTISAKHGVYAVTGNHEYFGGADTAAEYLHAHGITVLRDQSISVEGKVILIGREDRSYNQRNGRKRKEIEEILSGVQRDLPTIVLDHQPVSLDDAVRAGIDLQLSGHTHHGQLWPFNYITKKVYEVSWGYKKKENTHIYVSCGAGSWGPPVRTGNTPEILSIKLRFA